MLHLEHRPAPPHTTTTTPKLVKDIEDKTDAMSEMNTLDMSSKGGSNKTKQTKKIVQTEQGWNATKWNFLANGDPEESIYFGSYLQNVVKDRCTGRLLIMLVETNPIFPK